MDSSVGLYNNPWQGLTPAINGAEGLVRWQPGTPAVNFFSSGGKVAWERLSSSEDYKRLFELCSPLAAALTMKASAFANGIFETVNPDTGNYLRGQYKEWDTLFEQPNPVQSRAQFMTQLEMYRGLRGFCYAMPVYAAGFRDRPSAIWLLPPWCLEIEPPVIRKPFYQLTKSDVRRRIWFVGDGERTPLNEEDLILFTDNGSQLDPVLMLPEGRIRSLVLPISNLIGAMESRATLIQNRGATGILSASTPDSSQASVIPLEPKEKERLQNVYESGNAFAGHRGYGLSRGQFSIIVTDAALKWQPMVYDVKQLGLHEEHLSCIKDIYAIYGIPFPLSAHSDQATYNNVATAWRGFYQDTILPEAKGVIEQLNTGLRARENRIKVIVNFDVDYLQQSETERGQGRKALNDALLIEWDNGIITRNGWLKKLDEDMVTSENCKDSALIELFNKFKFQLTAEELGVMGLGGNASDNSNQQNQQRYETAA